MKKIFNCLIIICIGVFFFFHVYYIYDLILLKKTHELVQGNIEKIQSNSSTKSKKYWLVCSYVYKEKIYNKKIHVSTGMGIFIDLLKDYPIGETVFMLNYERDIIFPQNKINLEIQRRIFPFIALAIAGILALLVIHLDKKVKFWGEFFHNKN